jgi:hypothetical protein
MKLLVFFMGISNLPLVSKKCVSYHLDFKKYFKSIPNNNVTFQKVGDDFSYEKKLHQPKNYIKNFTTSILR